MPIQGFDLWFYLEFGRQVIEEFRIPWAESYLGTTETMAFNRHANHAWLSYAICYLFFKVAGMWGLVALRSLLITATAAVTYLNCRQFELDKSWSALLVILGVWSVKSRFLLRSVLFTDLFLAVLLFFLIRYERRGSDGRFPYLSLSLLMIVWTNTHQGVVVGCVCLFIWLLTRAIPWRTRFLALALVGLSCLVRPYGWWFPLFFTETFGNQAAISNVLEWAALSFSSVVTLLGPLILVGLLAVGLSARKEGFPWGNLVLGLAFLFLALRSQRAVGELLPVLVPMIASFLVLINPKKKWLAPFALALCGLLYYGWQGTAPDRLTRLNPAYPEGLIQALGPNHGQIFNSYELGNYLVFHQKKPFIHGITCLFQEQLVNDFQTVLSSSERREALIDQFDVQTFLLHFPKEDDATEGLVNYLYEHPNWKMVAWDDSGLLFTKGDANLGLVAVKPWQKEARWQNPVAAKAELEALVQTLPSARAHVLLSQLANDQKDWPEVVKQAKAALELEPNSALAWQALAFASFQLRDMTMALEATKQAARLAPDNPEVQFNRALVLYRAHPYRTGISGWLVEREIRHHLDETLRLSPGNKAVQALLNELDSGP